MVSLLRRFAVPTLVLAAAMQYGCSSGGGGMDASETSNPFESEASRQLNSELTNLIRGADTMVMTDIVSSGPSTGLNRTAPTDFGGSYEMRPYPFGDEAAIEDIAVMPSVLQDGVWLFRSRSANCENTECAAPVTVAENYGGWLTHSYFQVIFAVDGEFFGHGIDDEQFTAFSVGNDTGSIPINGSATWSGAMMATDLQHQEIVRGDAELSVNFSATSVDVAFTDIRELKSGATRAAIHFNNVPLSARGFQSGAAGHRITGVFYGPEHAEVGGVFEHEYTFGAFGAVRVQP